MIKTYSSTWDVVDKELLDGDRFGGNLKKAGWFKNEVEKGEPTQARAAEIMHLIKSKVQWDETQSPFTSKQKEALNKGVGNSADMNFLLINALSAGGFEAYPVILSTMANGRIPVGRASISAFNNVITAVKIDDAFYYTDASAKYGGWNILPEKCMVPQARMIISEKTSNWVDLSTVSTGTVFRQISVSFKDSESIQKVEETLVGNDAYNARNAYASFADDEKFKESIEAINNSVVDDLVLTGVNDLNDKFKVEFTETKNIDLDSEYVYFTPPMSKIYSENPFKLETRTYPINFDYLRSYIQLLEISIPEGYEVVEMPRLERIVLNDNQLSYTYAIRKEGNTVKINSKFQVRSLLFLPADYDSLKEFFSKMILKTNEQLVFKKQEKNE